ncbi:MAG: hypothetical protein ACK5QX_03880, partial [bacterium]
MTYALIDNATLTAVQRIMGDAPTRSKDNIDIDIIALENFVQAILFYDQIIVIDDYKEAYRKERQNKFSFVKFLDKTSLTLPEIEKEAYAEADGIRPKIRGGEFENEEFQELIGTLKTHMICTWDIASSVYYLTLKMLGTQHSSEFDKYGSLAAAIFSELNDCASAGGKSTSEAILYDSSGVRISSDYKKKNAKWGNGDTGGMTSGLQAFIASLVWLANRTIFYTKASQYLQADSFLYPIRQAYQQNYISRTFKFGHNYSQSILGKLSTVLANDIQEIQTAGLSVATAIDVPIFSAWIAKQTNNPSQIITTALEIKNDSAVIEIRERLREVRKHFDEDENITVANKKNQKLLQDIDKISKDVRAKYGIATASGLSVRRLVQVYNTAATLKGWPQLPEYEGSIKIPDFLQLKNKTGLAVLYSDIINDLSKVWALSDARDILGSKVQIDDTK